MERYDIAIIGTGPAGLEAAALALVRRPMAGSESDALLEGSADLGRAVRFGAVFPIRNAQFQRHFCVVAG